MFLILVFSSGAIGLTNSPYGQGTGTIMLDDLQCIGTERSIVDCQHAPFGQSNCQHTEDVGVKCQPSEYLMGQISNK